MAEVLPDEADRGKPQGLILSATEQQADLYRLLSFPQRLLEPERIATDTDLPVNHSFQPVTTSEHRESTALASKIPGAVGSQGVQGESVVHAENCPTGIRYRIFRGDFSTTKVLNEVPDCFDLEDLFVRGQSNNGLGGRHEAPRSSIFLDHDPLDASISPTKLGKVRDRLRITNGGKKVCHYPAHNRRTREKFFHGSSTLIDGVLEHDGKLDRGFRIRQDPICCALQVHFHDFERITGMAHGQCSTQKSTPFLEFFERGSLKPVDS